MSLNGICLVNVIALRARLLMWHGAKVGKNARICSSATIRGNGRLEIGDDVWVGAETFISPVGAAIIKIGSCCDIRCVAAKQDTRCGRFRCYAVNLSRRVSCGRSSLPGEEEV